MICANCENKGVFTTMTAIGEKAFCCEKCYAEYVGLPVEKEGYYGFMAESFEASVVHRGKQPKGAIGKAMMNRAMIERAEIESVIQELENKVQLGIISEDDLMKSLTKKFGAEFEVIDWNNLHDTNRELFVQKLQEYYEDFKENNPELHKEFEERIMNEESWYGYERGKSYAETREKWTKKLSDLGYEYERIDDYWEYIGYDNIPVYEHCNYCDGEGIIITKYYPATREDPAEADYVDCEMCKGKGKVLEEFEAENDYEDCQVCFTTVEKGELNDVQAGLICDTCHDMNKYAGGTGRQNNRPYNAEEVKLSKTSCCCGATESNPCACMKAPEPMNCSATEPKCPCYKALEKNAETFEAKDDSWCVNHGWIHTARAGDIIPCTSCNDMICEGCRCGGCGNCENSDCCECKNAETFEAEIDDGMVEYMKTAVNSAKGSLEGLENEFDSITAPRLQTKARKYTKGIKGNLEFLDERLKDSFYAETFEAEEKGKRKIGETVAWNNRIIGMDGKWLDGKYDLYEIGNQIGYAVVHQDLKSFEYKLEHNGVLLGSKGTDIAQISFAGLNIYTGGDGSFPIVGLYEDIEDYYSKTQNKPHPTKNLSRVEEFENYEKNNYLEAKWEDEFTEWAKTVYDFEPKYYSDGKEISLSYYEAKRILQENHKVLVGARISISNPSMPNLERQNSKSSVWVLEYPDIRKITQGQNGRIKRETNTVFINTEKTVDKIFANLQKKYPKGMISEGRYGKSFIISIPFFGKYKWDAKKYNLVYDSLSDEEKERKSKLETQKRNKEYEQKRKEKQDALKAKYGAESDFKMYYLVEMPQRDYLDNFPTLEDAQFAWKHLPHNENFIIVERNPMTNKEKRMPRR